MKCLFSSLIAVSSVTFANAGESFTMLESSCDGLEDGEHYIQPMGNNIYKKIVGDSNAEAPPIRVYCSHGYTIIDPNLDNNVIKYFSTYHEYHTTFAGPDLDEGINWRVWWLPTRMDFSATFMVSEDCETVETENSNIQIYGDETVYYMTGDSYGCNWPTKAMCDFDSETLECFTCSVNSDTVVKKPGNNDISMGENNEIYYGKCGHMPLKSTSVASTDHSSCTEDTGSYLPSIGLTGKYCVAYKLSTGSSKIKTDDSLIDYNLEELETELENEMLLDSKLTVYLDQDDFLEGTYRITKPGTYIITEDIEFDFNAGLLNDPNTDSNAWFPLSSQSEDYPGAGEWDGHYWLGFFAGITIETDNVILDLNGKSIGMTQAFYFQQRFFSCIELNNKIFLDGEGPTWTGVDITFAKNVIIKDGTVGLSSHIGIHGNKVTNLKIENVHVRDFETHGIGINEFYDLELTNVEIGPSIDGQLGLSGNYNLARYTLPIFRSAAEDAGIGRIKYQDRDDYVTFSSVVKTLNKHMNYAFNKAYFGEELEDNEEYDLAIKTFYNDWGISRAGTVYGLLLRSRGASVFSYGKDASGYSDKLIMNNVHIHDLKLCMEEIIALGISRNSWMRDVFNAPLNLESFVNNEFNGNLDETKYIGNSYLDAVFALKHFSSSWWYLGRLAIVSPFETWSRMIDPDRKDDNDLKQIDILGDIEHDMYLHCNYDALGHVPKGVIGLRMELSSNVEINNLKIENLYSFTPLGSEKCGAYKSGVDGGMPLQTESTNAGFGGTQVRAINLYGVSNMNANNIEIKNIMSLNGPAYGIHGAPNKGISSNVLFKNTNFEGIYSGVDLTVNELDYSDNQWPNPKASACAVEQNIGITFEQSSTTASCIFGHIGCDSCTKDGLCPKNGKYNDECSNVLEVSAKDLMYTIEPDGSISTQTTVNQYQDALTRLGTKALNTVSKKASKTVSDDTQEESTSKTSNSLSSSTSAAASKSSSSSSSSSLSSVSSGNLPKDISRNKMSPIKIKTNDIKNLNNKHTHYGNEGLSPTGQFFLYGSILLLLLILVVVSRRFTPNYRRRRGHELTFLNKLKYGKHGENYKKAMEEREQEREAEMQDKAEEFLRLMNNTVRNNDDDDYTRV